MLFVEYNNCPGQQETQISRQLNMYGAWWSGNLLFLQSLPRPLQNCDNVCKMLGTIYRRMTFSTFMTICMWEYTPVLPPDGATMCIDLTVWAPLTVTCSFVLVWICYHIDYSCNDKLPVASICSEMNWVWYMCLSGLMVKMPMLKSGDLKFKFRLRHKYFSQ